MLSFLLVTLFILGLATFTAIIIDVAELAEPPMWVVLIPATIFALCLIGCMAWANS